MMRTPLIALWVMAPAVLLSSCTVSETTVVEPGYTVGYVSTPVSTYTTIPLWQYTGLDIENSWRYDPLDYTGTTIYYSGW